MLRAQCRVVADDRVDRAARHLRFERVERHACRFLVRRVDVEIVLERDLLLVERAVFEEAVFELVHRAVGFLHAHEGDAEALPLRRDDHVHHERDDRGEHHDGHDDGPEEMMVEVRPLMALRQFSVGRPCAFVLGDVGLGEFADVLLHVLRQHIVFVLHDSS